jgi:hypothetical protein
LHNGVLDILHFLWEGNVFFCGENALYVDSFGTQ